MSGSPTPPYLVPLLGENDPWPPHRRGVIHVSAPLRDLLALCMPPIGPHSDAVVEHALRNSGEVTRLCIVPCLFVFPCRFIFPCLFTV